MDKVLHAIVILALLLTLIIFVKTKVGREESAGRVQETPPAVLVSIPLKNTPAGKSRADTARAQAIFVYPAPQDWIYAPTPRVYEWPQIEGELSQGPVEVAPAPRWPLRDKQIAPGPVTVIYRWNFSLP